MELLTAAQMRAIERSAIENGEVTGLELMERAGQGVVDAILEWKPELAEGARRAVVLCGPGNNGGDGFVVARLLKERGWDVEVFLYGDEGKLPPDAAENLQRWRKLGEVRSLIPSDIGAHCYGSGGIDIVVDALFGTGLTRPIDALRPFLELNDLYSALEFSEMPKTVAVDVPSGVCADSGRALTRDDDPDLPWIAVQADLTVTFHRPKTGHLLGSGPARCGWLDCRSIGMDDNEVPPGVSSIAKLTGLPARTRLAKLGGHAHKYSHGHALVLSGGCGRGGAARLAAHAALRAGAGLVTVGCPPAALQENAAQLNAVMLRPIADAEALSDALADDRIRAVALGMGLGVGERARRLTEMALGAGRRVVLDADALTSFADEPEELFRLTRGTETVLVPHSGEMGRIFPDLLDRLRGPASAGPAYSKIEAARDAAERAGCVVLLKGSDTVIAEPRGEAVVNSAAYERAAPWLATAGSGDVLAGLVAGLMARGLGPFEAAQTAAWLHVEAARRFGPGLIAEDLPEAIPDVFRDLGL
jgi:ADP-dependent NAD(P)H-hydrate dehydratase / NAD(P)H-hydrate epimerase